MTSIAHNFDETNPTMEKNKLLLQTEILCPFLALAQLLLQPHKTNHLPFYFVPTLIGQFTFCWQVS